MRLICGLLRLDGAGVDARELEVMVRCVTAPGLHPREQIECQGPCGMATLEFGSEQCGSLSSGRSGRGHLLAADLRLDSIHELACALGLETNDPEALLAAALDCWGPRAPDELLGDFAFASWNARTQTMLCGRDAPEPAPARRRRRS